ncbi:endonuclease domain-containing protein [Streptomyces sparsogenes]|uniref:endonuclease domain-containing protein n=1 Tax=Streptomyces sparsogenes TaxID=67365 RepID=UPI0033C38AD0
MTAHVRDRRCGKPTKKGTACTRGLHSWLEGFESKYADGCWRHMSQPFKEAAQERKQAEEEAWLAYLYADPICWGWPVPDALDNWTYPQGNDPNDRLSDEALALLMGGPESRSAAILAWWQGGRCAICGHRRHLVEDHDHVTGMVRGYLCRGCNTQEGVYGDPDTLFGKYRRRHPTQMLGLNIRYWDPFTQDYAQPAAERATDDAWTDAASEDIGL